ncbi:small ribosomal subunit Rsm22 family protein [Sphaerisporangium dianthi]|uniref:Small ribosomal subunit Rsm22 family protein n=1 Tax=Sphaerisporangium dianthi TaxID=1436120 RepID=A0ABV9CA99_9ACTN
MLTPSSSATLGPSPSAGVWPPRRLTRLSDRPPGVIRHPRGRKGLITLTLCADGVEERCVSKRHGDLYRAARAATWGDPWPWPAGLSGHPVAAIHRKPSHIRRNMDET